MADTVQTIKQLVAAKADTAAALAKEIWNYAELSYEETRSAAALIGALKNEGFTIEEGIAGIPTAFTATYAVGSGKGCIRVSFAGEIHDALYKYLIDRLAGILGWRRAGDAKLHG